MQQVDPQAYMSEAVNAYREGNIPLADVLCDTLLRLSHRSPVLLLVQGLVAVSLKEFKRAQTLLTELNQPLPSGAQPLLKNDKEEKPMAVDKFLKWAKFSPEQIGNLKDLAGLAAGFASGIGTAIAAFKTAQAALEMLGIFEKEKDPTQLMLEDIA